MTITESLRFAIGVKDDASGSFEKIGRSADKNLVSADTKTRQLSSSMTKFGAVAVASSGIVFAALGKAAGAYERAQLNADKLESSIENSGKFAPGAADRLRGLANALQDVTAANNDEIVAAESMLVQFGLTEGQVTNLTPLVVDLSRKMGIDLNAAAKIVGKSVEGTAGGLKKAGIIVDSTREKTDAYGATMDALKGTVGGYARTEGATFEGQMARLKNKMQDVEESVGKGAVPVLEQLVGVVGHVASGFNTVNDALGGNVGTFLAYGAAVAGVVGVVSLVGGQLLKLGTYAGKAVKGISSVAQSMLELKLAAEATELGIGGIAAAFATVAIPVVAGIVGIKGHLDRVKAAKAFDESQVKTWAAAIRTANGDVSKLPKLLADAAEAAGGLKANLGTFGRLKIADELTELGTTTQQFFEVVAGGHDAVTRYGDAMKAAGFGGRDLQVVLLAMNQQVDDNAKGVKEAATQATAAAAATDTLGASTSKTAQQQKEAAQAAKDHADQEKAAADAAKAADTAFSHVADEMTKVIQAHQEAATATALDSIALFDLNAALDAAADKADRYKTVLGELAGETPNVEAATIGYKQAVADASKALLDEKGNLDKTKKGLDDNTQAGRDNLTALQGIADQAFTLQGAQEKAGASTTALTGLLAFQRADFIKTAEQMGATATEASTLADKYGLIPANVPTAVKQVGIEDVRTKLDALRGDLTVAMVQQIETLVSKGKLDEANRILDAQAAKKREADIYVATPNAAAKDAELDGIAHDRTASIRVHTINDVTSGGPGYHPPSNGTNPPRAAGGPVKAGFAYTVNEHGEETFIPTVDGTIRPHSATSTVTNIDNSKTTIIMPAGIDPNGVLRAQRRAARRNGARS